MEIRIVEMDELNKEYYINKLRKSFGSERNLHEFRFKEQNKRKGQYLAAFVGKKIVGYMYIDWSQSPKDISRCCFNALHVHEDYRRQGVANTLLEYGEEMLFYRYLMNVRIYVEMDNQSAINLYLKRGFEIVKSDVRNIFDYINDYGKKCHWAGTYHAMKKNIPFNPNRFMWGSEVRDIDYCSYKKELEAQNG